MHSLLIDFILPISAGNSPIVGVVLRHKDSEGVMQTVRFVAPSDIPAQHESLSWAQALRMVS